MSSVVSEKGQITIPKQVRDRLGLVPGSVLELKAEDGKLVGEKRLPEDVFAKWRGRGRLPGGGSVDDYLARIRG
jgi:AbrB family looped-hinge helix DNA binding protein